MMTYELTNKQREFLGLDPIEDHWGRVNLKGDKYRTESVLYFDGDTIKRYIVSTDDKYQESQYNELTRDRTILLPKTAKGKEKRLTASVLEQRHPMGVYVMVDSFGGLTIGSYHTQTTFYSTRWERPLTTEKNSIADIVTEFIDQSPENHLTEINAFRTSARKNVKFKAGDYFSFKINRVEFGFGRLLLDVNKARKQGVLPRHHGLGLLMGPPLIIQLFAYKSPVRKVDIAELDRQKKLPADVMMDNLLLYGEYEIIGHKELKDDEFDFPISFGGSLDQRRIVFLQWGLIHRELPNEHFNKYLVGDKESDHNPYGYYSIGFRPHYESKALAKTLSNNGIFDFDRIDHYKAKWDLRNPKNKEVKRELFNVFGLDHDKGYLENCKLTGTALITEFIRQLK